MQKAAIEFSPNSKRTLAQLVQLALLTKFAQLVQLDKFCLKQTNELCYQYRHIAEHVDLGTYRNKTTGNI